MSSGVNGVGLYGNASVGQKYEQIDASAGTVVSLTPPTTLGNVPLIVIIAPQTGDMRWRDDGTNPTSTVGFLTKENNPITITAYVNELARWKFIMASGSAGVKLNVHYFTYANANGA